MYELTKTMLISRVPYCGYATWIDEKMNTVSLDMEFRYLLRFNFCCETAGSLPARIRVYFSVAEGSCSGSDTR